MCCSFFLVDELIFLFRMPLRALSLGLTTSPLSLSPQAASAMKMFPPCQAHHHTCRHRHQPIHSQSHSCRIHHQCPARLSPHSQRRAYQARLSLYTQGRRHIFRLAKPDVLALYKNLSLDSLTGWCSSLLHSRGTSPGEAGGTRPLTRYFCFTSAISVSSLSSSACASSGNSASIADTPDSVSDDALFGVPLEDTRDQLLHGAEDTATFGTGVIALASGSML